MRVAYPPLFTPVTLVAKVGSSALTITGATQTASFPPLAISQTWNNGSVAFDAITVAITNTASSSSSTIFKATTGGTVFFQVQRGGSMSVAGQIDLIASAGGTTNVQSTVRPDGFYTTSNGVVKWSTIASGSSNIFSGSFDLFIGRGAAATLQLGVDVNGAAVSQAIQACNGITGTDKTGGNLTLASGKGTGAGAVSQILLQTPTALGSGTTAQSLTTRVTVDVNGLKATGYLSSDGSAGVTAGPYTTITSITVKNGLVTALTGS